MTLTISIILIIVSVSLTIYSIYSLKNTHKLNEEIDNLNNKILADNKILANKKELLENEITLKRKNIEDYENQIYSKKQSIETYETQLDSIQRTISITEKNQEELSNKAFQNYCEILEQRYEEAENEHDMCMDALQTSYSNLQLKLMRELDETKADLDKIKATRAAAIQAQLKEKEIEENSSFYCLKVSDNELKDIAVLESIKPKLISPRILSMLIWQTYWRTSMTNLCNNIIGKITKTGIYKITNLKTKECYIGQAVDLATRWKDHAKCGLGIDTPAGNKLYKAMQEYGIWNFSWEVLEFCPKTELNEKEKYYINLYQAKEYGYNGNKGVGE